MRKAYILKKLTGQVRGFAALMLVTLLAVGNVFADEVTYVISEQLGYASGASLGSGTINDFITFTTDQGNASNPPKYYNPTSSLPATARFYGSSDGMGNSMTLYPALGYKITGVTLNTTGATPPVAYAIDGVEADVQAEATGSVYTWSGLEAMQSFMFRDAALATTQLRITSITITYEATGEVVVTPPAFSIPSGTYYTEQEVSLTAVSGANIYYVINDGDPVLYSTPFTVSSTSTITAYAVLGDAQSANATLTLTFPVQLANIAAFYAAENGLYKIIGDVQYVWRHGQKMYVQDATGGLLVFDNNNPVITTEYNEGDIISGGIVGTRTVYKNLVELVPEINTAAGTPGAAVVPQEVTVADVLDNSADYMSELVILRDGTISVSGNNKYFVQDGRQLQIYNSFGTLDYDFRNGEEVSVIGFVGRYNNNIQIFPRGNSDIIPSSSYTTLPFSCAFDGDNSAWTLVNADNTNKWYIGTAVGFDNNKLFVSASLGAANKYNVSAASISHAYINVNLPASDVILSFNCRSVGDANDYLQVSLLDETPEVGTLPETYLTRIYGMDDFDGVNLLIPASNAGVKYLVFTWINDDNGGNQTPAAIDNMIMYATCTAPTNVVSTVDGRSATITWDALDGQTAWDVQYKDVNSDAWQTVTANATSVTLNNLSTEVTYDLRVRTDCGSNGVSAWTNAQFYVPCMTQTTSQQTIEIGTGTSASNLAPMNNYYRHSWDQMIYPASNFETGGIINAISWYVNTTTTLDYNSLKIYLGTTNLTSNTSTSWLSEDELTLVYSDENGTLGGVTGWAEYTLETPYIYNGEDNLVVVVSRSSANYASGLQYRYTNVSGSLLYRRNDNDASYADFPAAGTSGSTSSNLPNIKLDYTGYVCGDEHCATPEYLMVSNITTDGAVLNWEAGDATAWRVNYKADYLDNWTIVDVTENTYTLTGLDQNTNYMVRVMADCGTVGMSNEAAVNFTTEANCPAPQYLDADAYAHTVNFHWEPVEGVNNYEVHVTGANNLDYTLNVQNASQVNITGLQENGQYVFAVRALCGEEETSDWSSIDFTMPTICPNVIGVIVSDIQPNAAVVTWNAGEATSWVVEYGLHGFTLGEGTQVNVSDNTVTLSGLNASAVYDVYVKADCGLGYVSNWNSATVFMTDCGPIVVTNDNSWTEDFEWYTGSGEKPFVCWATPLKPNGPFVYCNYSGAAHSGKNSAELKGRSGETNLLVFPEFANDIKTLSVSFWASTTNTSNYGTMELGYVTDVTDANTFVNMTNIVNPGSRSNPVFMGPFMYDVTTAPADARMALRYSGAGSYSAESWNLDDFTVSLIPDCKTPTAVTVSEITENSAILSWTANGAETAWNIEYGPVGFEPGTGAGTLVAVNTNPFTITDLNAYTIYDVYVQADCGQSVVSDWSVKAMFKTACGPITITESNPWIETFEEVQGSGNTAFDNCWATPMITSYGSPFIYCGWAPSCHSGVNSAELKGDTDDPAMLVLPYFTNALSDLQFSYYGAVTGYTPGTMLLGYITDANDASTFVEIQEIPAQSASYNRNNSVLYGPFSFSNEIPTGARIALKFTSATWGCSWNLDDFTVELAPGCTAPDQLTINSQTSTSVTLGWNENGDATAWNIQYGPADFELGEGTIVAATTNPFTLSPLAPMTTYDFYVQSNCGDKVSDWSEKVTTLLSEVYTMNTSGWDTVTTCGMIIYDNGGPDGNYSNNCNAYLVVYPEIAGAFVHISGTTNNEGSSWDYLDIFDGVGNTGTRLGHYAGRNLTVDVTSESGPVTIYFKSDGTTVYSGFELMAECIIINCPKPKNLAVSDLSATSAVVSWKAGGNEAEWILEYKESSASEWNTVNVNDTTFTLSDLVSLTMYNIRVKADCGDDVSEYVETSFTTEMIPVNLPYATDFTEGGWILNNGTCTNQWAMGTPSNKDYPALFVSNDGNTAAYTVSSAISVVSAEKLFLMPADDSIHVVFDAEIGGEGNYDFLKVFLSPSEVNYPASTTNTVSYAGISYSENAFDFSDYLSQTGSSSNPYKLNLTQGNIIHVDMMVPNPAVNGKAKLVFLWRNDNSGGTQPGAIISNLQVGDGVICAAPKDLTATAVENGSSTITWTAGGEETSWIITLTPNEGDVITATVSAPTYTVTDMEPGDSYEVAVKAVCSEEEQSAEVTTTVLCPALVDIAIVSINTNLSNCELTDLNVTIEVWNTMESLINSFEAYYQVNGAGPIVHETVTLDSPMEEFETRTYTFHQAPIFTEAANVVTAWVEVAGETNLDNNTMLSGITYLTDVKTLPYEENFSSLLVGTEWPVIPNNDRTNNTFSIHGNAIQYTSPAFPNDWIISPCVEYTPYTTYIFSFDYKANSPYFNEQFSVYVGPSVNPDEDYLIQTFNFNNTEFVHFDFVGYMNDEASNMHLAFHADGIHESDGFTIDNVSIKKANVFTVLVDEHGSATVNNAISQYSYYYAGENEPVTLFITPEVGYHVAAIYVNGVLARGENTNNSSIDMFTFTPSNGDIVTITFTGNTYSVDATVGNVYVTDYNNTPGAVYTPAHEQVVHGGSHTGIITIAQNYSLEYVLVNGADVTESLENIGDRQYKLTLDPVMEDKDVYVLTRPDSAYIAYVVTEGQGIINNEFVVDANTPLPAYYVTALRAYSDLLSTITPAPGYHVSSIYVDGVQHNNIEVFYFEHVVGDHTVFVAFSPNTYNIATSAIGNGTVSADTTFEYDPDFTYTFTATPDVGNHIAKIIRNGVELDVENPSATYTETLTNITDNYNYVVEFDPNTYTVTATCGTNGTISPNGVSYYFYHQDAEIIIMADLGYYISSVTVDGFTYDLPQNELLNTLTVPFMNIIGDHTINATFAPLMYNVTVNAGSHGTITPGTGSFQYGSTPIFTITPDEGYAIVDVTVDGASMGAVSSYTFPAITEDHTIAANFAAQAFTITATAGNGGTITPSGVANLAYNGNQSYTITPSTGHHVSDVFVDGVSVGAVTSYSFTGVTADHTIYAEFAPNDYTVTVNAPSHATITPGTMTVQYGATPFFIITPDFGYDVTGISVNGTSVNLNNVPNVNGVYTYTFAPISSNQTITATTTAKTYTIAASADSNGSITPNGNTTVNHGNTQSYTITPANGYVVDNVTVDGLDMGALTVYTFTNVVANHTIHATFKTVECEVPDFLFTSHIDNSSAELHWSHPAAGITFDIQYKTPTGSLTSVSNVSGNSYALTNLNAGTTYMWQVRANCTNSNHSDWSNLVYFTTDNNPIDVGIEDLVKNNIKVYADHQNVHIINNEGMNIENVRIFDAYGRLVYTGAVNTAHEVIGLNVAAGTYVVNVTTDKGIANYKVTLMK